jgi:phospholipid/cholesterol/gamma-HCH transport system substrate-binding protein
MITGLRRHGTVLANLAVLVVLLVGVYHVGFNILRLNIARDPFPVTLQLATSGGLYERSEVTYRGKLVGSVSDIKLAPDGVEVKLRIDKNQKIPSNLDAVVANLSPAGEQFVDLRPRTTKPPFLRSGDVIPRSRTSVPVPVPVVVRDVAKLLDQIGAEDLRVVVDEMAAAFGGTGPAMREIIEASDSLIAAAQKDLPAFSRLLANGRKNLETAEDLSGQFTRFNTALRELSRQVKAGGDDIGTLLEDSPGFVGDLNTFVTTLSTPISALLGNLVTPGSLISARLPALNAMLIAFPESMAAMRLTVRDGKFRAELHLTDNLACEYPGPRRTPIDPTRTAPNLNKVCTDTRPGVGGRGAQNAPKPGPSGPGTKGWPTTVHSTYDPSAGMVVLPDGTRLSLGSGGDGGTGSSALAILLALLRD